MSRTSPDGAEPTIRQRSPQFEDARKQALHATGRAVPGGDVGDRSKFITQSTAYTVELGAAMAFVIVVSSLAPAAPSGADRDRDLRTARCATRSSTMRRRPRLW